MWRAGIVPLVFLASICIAQVEANLAEFSWLAIAALLVTLRSFYRTSTRFCPGLNQPRAGFLDAILAREQARAAMPRIAEKPLMWRQLIAGLMARDQLFLARARAMIQAPGQCHAEDRDIEAVMLDHRLQGRGDLLVGLMLPTRPAATWSKLRARTGPAYGEKSVRPRIRVRTMASEQSLHPDVAGPTRRRSSRLGWRRFVPAPRGG